METYQAMPFPSPDTRLITFANHAATHPARRKYTQSPTAATQEFPEQLLSTSPYAADLSAITSHPAEPL